MKRRDFFKFLGKGAAAAGVAATVGVPEVKEDKPEWEVIILDKEPRTTFHIPPGFPEDSYSFLVSQALSDEEIEEAYQSAKRSFYGMRFPELAPLWEPTTFNGLSDYITTGHDADA